MAYYATIYGTGFTLTDAPADLHRDALNRAMLVSCLFLAAVLVDLRQQTRGRRRPLATATAAQ